MFWVMDDFAVDGEFFWGGYVRSSLPTCSDSCTSSGVYAWESSVIVIIYVNVITDNFIQLITHC